MQARMNIIGSGIAGLFTAYYLCKSLPEANIEIYDSQDKWANNATTNSLAWLNAIYPSKDSAKHRYDQYRVEAIQAWQALLNDLAKDGITEIASSQQLNFKIQEQEINSLHVFFNSKQEIEHINNHKRLEQHADNLQTNKIEKAELEEYFPFLANLPDQIIIHNVAYEQLINPNILRMKLINFLEKNNVTFHWNTAATPEMIQADPNAHWVIAAGAGCLPLVKNTNTKLKEIPFHENSIAELIYCNLAWPLDLKGKVLHFYASDTTPSFHLRNDENNINKLKIVIARQGGKTASLEKIAEAIFNLLQIQVNNYYCTDTVIRPVTQDTRPLVEMKLGEHKNIHIIYGHSLFTNAAKIFPSFANHLVNILRNKAVYNSTELQQFSSARFGLTGLYTMGKFAVVTELPQKPGTTRPIFAIAGSKL